jgi:hypothetical protein
MQRAVGLSTGIAQQLQRDGVKVNATVAVAMRTGKLEIRLR